MCKILHILVCYYNEDEIFHFVKNEIFYQNSIPDKILIVNNGTNNINKLLKLEEMGKGQISVLNFNKNLGYLGAFNAVLKNISREYYDFVILSNSDIQFVNHSFYKYLCKYSLKEDIGVITPSIFTKDFKHNLNPYMVKEPSIKKLKLLKLIYSSNLLSIFYSSLHYISRFIKNIKKYKKMKYENEMDIYAPHGSFIIFTKKIIKKFDFHYGAFLFGEEIYIGEICKRLGLKVKFIPQLKVIHKEHSTTGKWQIGKMRNYKKESLDFIIKFLENKVRWNVE